MSFDFFLNKESEWFYVFDGFCQAVSYEYEPRLKNTGLHKASRVGQSYSCNICILYVSMLHNSMVHTDSAFNNLLMNIFKWVLAIVLMNMKLSCTSLGSLKSAQEATEANGYQPDGAANNSWSSDNGPPKFANVWRNRNLGRTFCPTNFLFQHLTISFTNKIWLSYTLLFQMYLCVYVRPNFPIVRPKWCPSRTWYYVLSR